MKKLFLFSVLFLLSINVSAQNFWVSTNASLGSKVTGIVINSINEVFASTQSNGVYFSSDNGENWVSINNGLQSTSIISLAISPSTQTILSLDYNGVYRSADNSSSWDFITIQPYTAIMNLDCNLNGDFFGGTPLSGVIRSTDDGLTWHLTNTGLTQYSIPSFGFEDTAMVFCSGGGSGAVFRSSNYGDSWTPISLNGLISYVVSLAAYNGILYAGTSSDGVFSTDYNQINWTAKNNGLLNTSILKIKIISNGYIYLATQNGGMYCSFDSGDSWSEINSGLTELAVSSLAIAPDGFLYCGTESGQIYRSYNSTTSVNELMAEIPKTLGLNQNYPNPFNPSTKISWQAPVGSWQTLKVYDVLGNELATLVNEYRSAGSYEIEFNPSSINHQPSSGVYFYRLQVGDYVETKKMIYLN